MSEEAFTSHEAKQLLGKAVQAKEAFKNLPTGTPGRIIMVRLRGETGARVAVQWKCPESVGLDEFTKSEFGRLLAVVG